MENNDKIIHLLNKLYSDLTTDSTYDGTWLDNWFEKNLPEPLSPLPVSDEEIPTDSELELFGKRFYPNSNNMGYIKIQRSLWVEGAKWMRDRLSSEFEKLKQEIEKWSTRANDSVNGEIPRLIARIKELESLSSQEAEKELGHISDEDIDALCEIKGGENPLYLKVVFKGNPEYKTPPDERKIKHILEQTKFYQYLQSKNYKLPKYY